MWVQVVLACKWGRPDGEGVLVRGLMSPCTTETKSIFMPAWKEKELSHPHSKGLLSLPWLNLCTPLGLTAGEGDVKSRYGSGEKREASKGCWSRKGYDERRKREK